MQTFILIAALLLTTTVACAESKVPPGMAKATFVVHCYDVGASALSGKPGIISVERGWSGPREVDRVVYDPSKTTLTELENWLKDADTYVSTQEHSINREPAQKMSR